MNPSETINLFGQQIPLALVLVFLQNWLKKQKWFSLIDFNTPRANHLFAIVVAGLATIGIHFTWSVETHTLVISGLDSHTLLAGGWHWLSQYIIAKTGYHALADKINPSEPKVATTQTIAINSSLLDHGVIGGK